LPGRAARLLTIPRKNAGHQNAFVIQTHRRPMGFGDPSAGSTPDHSDPDSSCFL
jgi:hypothetical protein